MDSTFDKEKILDCMFDPDTSEILAELENGGQEFDTERGTLTRSKDIAIRDKLHEREKATSGRKEESNTEGSRF